MAAGLARLSSSASLLEDDVLECLKVLVTHEIRQISKHHSSIHRLLESVYKELYDLLSLFTESEMLTTLIVGLALLVIVLDFSNGTVTSRFSADL